MTPDAAARATATPQDRRVVEWSIASEDPATATPTAVEVPRSDLAVAIRRLVGGDAGVARRVLDRIEQGDLAVAGLWTARTELLRRPPVALAVLGAGRTVNLVLSPLSDDREQQAASRMLREILAGMRAPADIAQTMLEAGRSREARSLLDAGFRHLATLRFMDRPIDPHERFGPLPDGLSIRACGDDDPAELAGLLGRTYEDTLDCPGLAGLRRVEDVLAGHRAAGRFDPAAWILLELDGVPVGVSFANPNPEVGCVELVYFGLVKAARGRGLARRLLARTIADAARHGLRRLTLAVDERNLPAITLYRRLGFTPGGVREAFIRPLDAPCRA